MTLFPVVLPVAEADPNLSGAEKVARLSKIAREALRLSAEKSGVVMGELLKNEDDVPYPSNGNYWSLSHKPRCVAAVVSDKAIGIDIDEIRPRQKSAFNLVASEEEWKLSGDRSWESFFRYWTAKEAALKAIGIGMSGLKKCRVVSLPDENHMLLEYQDRIFQIEQLYYRNHIVSVLKDDNEIRWVIAPDFSHC
jgi:4'-phosphopantetheinyl transferase